MKKLQFVTKLNSAGETVICDCRYASGIEVLEIPQGVRHIDCSFFAAKPTLKSVVLPQGLKTIGRFAFSGTQLIEIILPATLEQIGDYAFSECRGLREIIIPESVTEIGSEAFKLCVGLKTVALPSRLNRIGTNAFSQSGIERLNLTNSPTRFYRAFSSCENLKEVVFERGVEKIDDGAFAYCKSLKNVVLSEGLIKIGKKAFDGCISLEKIVLPSTLKKMDEGAFANCTSLKEVVMPSGIEEVSGGAFYRCENLEKINIPHGALVENNAFEKCYKMPPLSAKIARDYKNEDDGMEFFITEADGCSYVKSVNGDCLHKTAYVPGGIFGIANGAFAGMPCDCVVLPEGVQEVGEEAFKNCEYMRAVYLPESVRTVKKDAFAGCKNLRIYCESEPQKDWSDDERTVQEYVEAPEGWNDYQHNKMNSHWEKVTRIIRNSYNPDKRPVYTNVSREEFLKNLK